MDIKELANSFIETQKDINATHEVLEQMGRLKFIDFEFPEVLTNNLLEKIKDLVEKRTKILKELKEMF